MTTSGSSTPSLAAPTTQPEPVDGVATAWTQVGPDGALLARAITGESECPEASVDGTVTSMELRVGPASSFPNSVCELTIDAGVESLSVDDLDLPLLAEDPQTVAVVGDTGCKVEQETIQDCSDPAAWPLETVASEIAGQDPDLIIHVGDIVYREAPCPAGDSRCEGSPVGSTWPSNDADLFTPLGDNIRAAPWLFSRGNHESCTSPENGPGWFRYFDPYPFTEECTDYQPMYTVAVGDREIAVLDASAPNTGQVDPAIVAQYQSVFDETLPEIAADSPTWLLTHAPMWGFIVIDEGGSTQQVVDTINLQKASGNQLPDGVEVVLSGGVHGAQALRFADGRPMQIVSGNGGDLLDPPLQQPLEGTEIAGTTVESGFSADVFGYSLLQRDGDEWTTTFVDVDGNELFSDAL